MLSTTPSKPIKSGYNDEDVQDGDDETPYLLQSNSPSQANLVIGKSKQQQL